MIKKGDLVRYKDSKLGGKDFVGVVGPCRGHTQWVWVAWPDGQSLWEYVNAVEVVQRSAHASFKESDVILAAYEATKEDYDKNGEAGRFIQNHAHRIQQAMERAAYLYTYNEIIKRKGEKDL